MKIDNGKSIPKYLQVKGIIQQYFTNQHYEADQKIPSENELAAQFNVSRNTIRQALGELVKEGLLYKRHGSGSFFSGKTGVERDRTRLIGVITPVITYYIYPQIIHGIDDIAHQRQYSIVLGNSKADSQRELACLEQLLAQKVEGLIVELTSGIQDVRESKAFQILKDLTIPVVFMDWVIDDPEISYVSVNDFEGGFKAAQYLIESGHTRISFVYPGDHLPALDRYSGYKKALTMYGIAHDDRLDKTTTIFKWHEPDLIYRLMRELIDLGDARPSAVIFFNDEAALKAYPAIQDAGLRIPDDFSVIGFDDSDMAKVANVPLTSVTHPKYHLGRWAAHLVFDAIDAEGQVPKKHMLLNPTIVERDSVKFLNEEKSSNLLPGPRK